MASSAVDKVVAKLVKRIVKTSEERISKSTSQVENGSNIDLPTTL
jgi:hypothetical protein